jgi:transcription factor TGA
MIINLVGAAIFDMEYARWLEDDHRLMSELRTGLHAHLSDGDLRLIIDGYVSHYDEIFRLKGVATSLLGCGLLQPSDASYG